MQLLKLGTTALAIIALGGCSPWRSWIPEHPNNEAYEKSGYGKNNRYYSQKNTEGMIRQIQATKVSGVPIERQRAIASREKLAFSIELDKQKTIMQARDYFNNYRNTLFADDRVPSTDDPKAPQREYFDVNEYNKLVPRENIFKARRLRAMNALPMTANTAQIIEKYYKYMGLKGPQTKNETQRQAKAANPFQDQTIEYTINPSTKRSKYIASKLPKDIIRGDINEQLLDNQNAAMVYYGQH